MNRYWNDSSIRKLFFSRRVGLPFFGERLKTGGDLAFFGGLLNKILYFSVERKGRKIPEREEGQIFSLWPS